MPTGVGNTGAENHKEGHNDGRDENSGQAWRHESDLEHRQRRRDQGRETAVQRPREKTGVRRVPGQGGREPGRADPRVRSPGGQADHHPADGRRCLMPIEFAKEADWGWGSPTQVKTITATESSAANVWRVW